MANLQHQVLVAASGQDVLKIIAIVSIEKLHAAQTVNVSVSTFIESFPF